MSSFADELLTVAEVAEQLKLNPQTIRNWIDADKLSAVRIGRRVRVKRVDLEAMLARASAPSPPAPPPAENAGVTLEDRVAAALASGLSSEERAELAGRLRALADQLSPLARG